MAPFSETPFPKTVLRLASMEIARRKDQKRIIQPNEKQFCCFIGDFSTWQEYGFSPPNHFGPLPTEHCGDGWKNGKGKKQGRCLDDGETDGVGPWTLRVFEPRRAWFPGTETVFCGEHASGKKREIRRGEWREEKNPARRTNRNTDGRKKQRPENTKAATNVAAFSRKMVPKRGLEPPRGNPH